MENVTEDQIVSILNAFSIIFSLIAVIFAIISTQHRK
jgi:hypothetical protein